MIFTKSLNITQFTSVAKLNDTLRRAWGPRLAVWLATGLGVGLYVPAPGTFGAAWGSLLAWGIAQIPGLPWQVVAIVALNLVGIPLCTAAGRLLGGKKDHPSIVWDEIVTMPAVFLLVPLTNWKILAAGFFLHRLLDTTKPPPARQLERLPDGLGVMADDWAASGYACVLLYALAWLDRTNEWGFLSAG
jgi:phosphatidylglycerophosphatase A